MDDFHHPLNCQIFAAGFHLMKTSSLVGNRERGHSLATKDPTTPAHSIFIY